MKDEKMLKQKVAEAAIVAFNDKGVKFRMDDLAAMLGMSKKTLYKLYDSKEELVMTAVELGFGSVMESKEAIINDPGLDIASKIRKVIIEIPEKYRGIDWRRLYEFKDAFPEAYARVCYYLDNGWEGTLGLVSEGIRQGKIRNINLSVFRSMLENAFMGFISNSDLLDSGISYQDALEGMIDIVMNGIVKGK